MNKTKGRASELDMHIAKQAKTQRLLMGLKQDQVAQKMGVSFQQLQKYEGGVNRIAASRLYELAKILQVEISYFYEGYSPDKCDEIEEDKCFDHLSKIYSKITDTRDREVLLNLAKSLLK